jgi:hypothetical protein
MAKETAALPVPSQDGLCHYGNQFDGVHYEAQYGQGTRSAEDQSNVQNHPNMTNSFHTNATCLFRNDVDHY